MKALVVVNEYCLNARKIQEVNADCFYSLFNKDGLYIESDDHFKIEGYEINRSLKLLNSLEKK
jgi:hypothetical protein